MINLTSYSGLGAAPLPRTIRRARSRDARGFRGYRRLSLLLQNVADQESADEGRDPLPRELRARFHLTEGEGEEAAPMRRGGSIEKLDEFARVPHMGPGLDFSHDLQGGAVIFEMIIGAEHVRAAK